MYRFDQGNLQNVPDYGSDMERDNARFEIEMRRLQASNAYSMADQQNRAKMEAQLIAMKEGYLPAGMAQNLIGVPAYNGQPNNGAQPGETGGGDYNPSGVMGFGGGLLGAGAGAMTNEAFGAGLGKMGQAVTNAGSLGDVANRGLKAGSQGLKQGTANMVNKMSGKTSNKIFSKLLGGAEVGAMNTSVGIANLGSKLAGKGSTKAAGSVLGKIGGKVASKAALGAVVGGIPGFLVGTAIGAAIEKLMEGNEKDQAKAQFMLSQYR